MKNLILTAILTLCFNSAFANTYTFDDLPTPDAGGNLISSYNNLSFESIGAPSNSTGQLGYIDPTPFLTAGVDYTGFNKNIIFNPLGFEAPTSSSIMLADSGVFDFIGGFWSAGITGDATITFEGYLNGLLTKTSSKFILQRDVVSPIALNWFGIDALVIQSSAAIWVADNLEINLTRVSSVPVPAAIWLLATAMLGFAGYRRKSF